MTKENFVLVYLFTGFLVCVGIVIWYFRRARQERQAMATAQRLVGRYIVVNFSEELKVIDLRQIDRKQSLIVFRLFPEHCTQQQLRRLWLGRQVELVYNSTATNLANVPMGRFERFLELHFV